MNIVKPPKKSADRSDNDSTTLTWLLAQKEIEAVLADYAIGMDDRDTERLLSAFAEDAVLDAAKGVLEGHAAILEWAEEAFKAQTMAHLTGNHRIDIIDEKSAKGVGGGFGLSKLEDGTVVLAFARLIDRYSKINRKWRISYRKIHLMSSFKLNDPIDLIINGILMKN